MNLPTYNEDPAVLHVGTMENHAYFIPFSDAVTIVHARRV